MLRNYIGDSAFFKGYNLYLTQNKFSSAEADDLRHAFEKVTGEDLNWFFNQWFYRGGHPVLNVSYKWDSEKKKEIVTIKQMQDLKTNPLYKLPLDIDFYFENSIERKKITVTKSVQEFEFPLAEKPKDFDHRNFRLLGNDLGVHFQRSNPQHVLLNCGIGYVEVPA